MADAPGHDLAWYGTRKRALIPLDDRFRMPRSLRRVLNQARFSVAINQDFAGVVAGCADRDSTWISDDLKEIYQSLYEAGWAYSFETWQDGQLAGGILGLVLGGAFMGESMFHRVDDASKVAMVRLVEHLRSRHFLLFDAQIINPHLERFGAFTVPDPIYRQLLSQALQRPCRF